MKTITMLEQFIIRNEMQINCAQIKKKRQGLDFYYNKRSSGIKFMTLLKNLAPIRIRSDNRHLVSHDNHSDKYEYKYNYLVEIAPVCRDDLIFLPHPGAQGSGSILICIRITNQIQLIEPTTLYMDQIDSKKYWSAPFRPIMSSNQLSEVTVLNVEKIAKFEAKFQLAEVEVANMKDTALDQILWTRSHLGNIIKVGDKVLGYEIAKSNISNSHFDSYISHGNQLPDITLVRKSVPQKYTDEKMSRIWRSRNLRVKITDTESHSIPREFFNGENKTNIQSKEIEDNIVIRLRNELYSQNLRGYQHMI